MLTRCPRCQRELACRLESLKATRGLVACGHCRAVFNAWIYLLDLAPSLPQPESAESAEATPPVAERTYEPALATVLPETLVAVSAQGSETETLLAPDSWPEFDPFASKEPNRAESGGEPAPEPEPGTESPTIEVAAQRPQEPALEAAAPSPMRESDADFMTDTLALPMRPRHGEQEADATSTPGLAMPTPAEATGETATATASMNLPVDPPWYRQERRSEPSAMGWLWGLALTVLLLLLLAQVVWLQAGRIAIEWPSSRPYWVQLCDQLGCDVPWQRAVERIKVRQSDVREQPGRPDGLLVTITLVNEATFEQPYPAIDLSLGDGTEPNAARRRFTPEEYLGPDGRHSFLPVGQAVQVLLELAGRHDLATTYTIELH